MKPHGVILAGGRATRMGGADKALLPFGAATLIAHVRGRLEPQVAALAINANGDPARFDALGLPVIADSVAGYAGPLAGILAGMSWAAEAGATHIVTAATDTPFFPPDLVVRLQEQARASGAPIALAATRAHLHPTFGLWPVALRGDLALAMEAGTRKLRAWAETRGAVQAMFDDAPRDPFFNINTQGDLAAAIQRAGVEAE